MARSIQSEVTLRTTMRQSVAGTVAGPDPTWRGLYRAGGVSAILYILLGLVVPTVLVMIVRYDFELGGEALLTFIARNRLWWIVVQTLLLESSILAIVTFAALFVALKQVNKSYAAIGAIAGVVAHVLFMAYYPVLLGLVYLSDQYVAATDAQHAVFATAAESLIAQVNAFNPFYEPLFAVGILILSLVMLKGVFAKGVAYLGIATCAAAFIAMPLWPVVGIGYFWWWLFFAVWFIAVGWKLYRLGGI